MGASQRRRVEERVAGEIGLMLILVALAAIQTTLLPRPFGSPPNLILLLVIALALLVGPSSAARWAFYGGLALDLCARSVIGSHALALLAAVLCAALPLMRMSQSNWLLPLLGTLFGAVGYYTVLALLTSALVMPVEPRAYATVVALPETLVALIPALPLFLLLRWWRSRRRGEVPIDVY